MTTGPENPPPEPTAPYGAVPPPEPTVPYGAGPPPPPPPPPPAAPGYAPQAPGYPQPGFPGAPYGVSPQAPYGIHPRTGIPYSEKSKIVAGVLQLLLPFGIGRYYIGDTTTGVWQTVATVLTCGIAHIWVLIDGILILVNDDAKDSRGYILRS
jgi:TM2 domain-containing membrane protein YozV